MVPYIYCMHYFYGTNMESMENMHKMRITWKTFRVIGPLMECFSGDACTGYLTPVITPIVQAP